MSGISALRGFRTQFLYSLWHILSDHESNVFYHLEGNEDLDVLDQNHRIVKTIQIKNLNVPLVQSHLLAAKKTRTSFLKRYIEIRKSFPNIEPIVVSFGDISAELWNWKLNAKKKETNIQFKKSEWEAIKIFTQFKRVNEETLLRDSIGFLKKLYPAIDPEITIDFLAYWLSIIAEKQHLITKVDLLKKVDSLLIYASESASSINQFGKTIFPLHLEDKERIDTKLLSEEFYRGTNTRFAHILNGLDIVRPGIIDDINYAFHVCNIVVLYGVSGQGKSTIGYRYAYDKIATSLIYELDSLQNLELCRQTILSIKAITKSLETPVLFIINVPPNSISWLELVKEFSTDVQTRFLVTVRQEDWNKAQSSGIKFIFRDVEINLSSDEAVAIYSGLNAKHTDYRYADFEEAWIQFGERGPLLEFVHFITQGESLRNTLAQQLAIIENESITNKSLLDLLRLVCLADSYGARLVVDRVKLDNLSIVIKRLEKEYLVKLTDDKRYIAGLHPQRSTLLVANLFDEFVSDKKTFALSNLSSIEDKDIFNFLLNLFNEGLDPKELLKPSNQSNVSWTYYHGLFKALLWAGINEYITKNENLLHSAYNDIGDAWEILIDLYFGDINPLENALNISFIDNRFRERALNINKQLSPKDEIFVYVKSLLSPKFLPSQMPISEDDWSSYGQLLFWENHISKEKNIVLFSHGDYYNAFQSLSIYSLSSLMFGMSWNDSLLKIKNTNDHFFLHKLRNRFNIPELIVNEEISANYILDFTNNDQEKKSDNDRSMEILSILRKAYPEKLSYNSQAYGNKTPFISIDYDGTTKTIPAKNLPLEEWVEINMIARRIFQYKILPDDWSEFHILLRTWEQKLEDLISNFNECFEKYCQNGLKTQCLVPIIQNSNSLNLTSLKPPKSITDPFGVSFDKSVQFSNSSEIKLNLKYKKFFKDLRDYRTSLENFIKQSSEIIHYKLHGLSNKIEDNIIHISQRNIFDSIKNISTYEDEKLRQFNKFINGQLQMPLRNLKTSAFIWKHYLTNKLETHKSIESLSNKFMVKLKVDFDTRLKCSYEKRSQKGRFIFEYKNDSQTKDHPIIIINLERSALTVEALQEAFNATKESIGELTFTSLKYLMLETQYQKISFLPIVRGNSLNHQWYQISYYTFLDKDFTELQLHQLGIGPIDNFIKEELQLTDWSSTIYPIIETRTMMENYAKILLILQHLIGMEELIERDLDELGQKLIEVHFQNKMEEVQVLFQHVLTNFNKLFDEFPEDKEMQDLTENEQEYWYWLYSLKGKLLPVPKGEEEYFEVRMNFDMLKVWADNLASIFDQMGILAFMLYDKHIYNH